VRITQGHLDRRWPISSCTAFSGTALINQMRSEGVPQDLPGDLAQPGPSARTPHRTLSLVLLEGAAGVVAEDQLTLNVPVRLERRERVAAERKLAVTPTLRRCD
jgi:hypothetical protein